MQAKAVVSRRPFIGFEREVLKTSAVTTVRQEFGRKTFAFPCNVPLLLLQSSALLRLLRVLPEYREAANAVNIMRRVPVGERTTVDEAVEFIRSQWGKLEGLRRDDRQVTKR